MAPRFSRVGADNALRRIPAGDSGMARRNGRARQPPWGEIVAVNVNTGDIAWRIRWDRSTNWTLSACRRPGTPEPRGRTHRHGGRRDLHRRRHRRPLPRVRRADRQGTLGDQAGRRRQGDADHLSGQERQAVRGDPGRRRRNARRRTIRADDCMFSPCLNRGSCRRLSDGLRNAKGAADGKEDHRSDRAQRCRSR